MNRAIDHKNSPREILEKNRENAKCLDFQFNNLKFSQLAIDRCN